MLDSALGCVGGIHRGPRIGIGVIAAASIRKASRVLATPDKHSCASPHCSMEKSRGRCIVDARRLPSVVCWIVPTTTIKNEVAMYISTPDDHLRPCPHCRMVASRTWCIRQRHLGPCVSSRIIPIAGAYILAIVEPTPHDHFASRPDRTVVGATCRHIY